MKIRLCKHNSGAEKAFEKFKSEGLSSDIKLKDCVKQCKICRKTPFVKLDKKNVDAASWVELEEMLIKSATM